MIAAVVRFCAVHRYWVLAAVAVALVASIWTMRTMPLDAIPDLSDTQVIVFSKWDRSPDIIEDQVTYPMISALVGAPKVKAVRGFSDFGYSYVYVIFEDGTDVYWARSRVLEYLSKITAQLPAGVKTELGPDATTVGWGLQYALVDHSGKHSLDELRSFQDWFLRYAIASVPGVAEVASVGGQVRQYQVSVDPVKLANYGLSIETVIDAVRKSNNDVGGRLVELSGREYMVRGRGYVHSEKDLESVVLKTEGGTPITVGQVASVSLGPEMRRGIADYNGQGDIVGGIVVLRQGENALNVIARVKDKFESLKPSLPDGVSVEWTYDRSDLIHRAIGTVRDKVIEEIIIVSLMILLFLRHVPSAIVAIVTIPVSVVLAFIPMYFLGLSVNLMSLAGIAISIGVLVDGAIVEVENAYNRIHRWQQQGSPGSFFEVRLAAMIEVAPSVFFSLLVIAVAFLPVFTLVDQEGRLFRPLAVSKTLAMAIAAILAITLDPALRMLFSRAKPVSFRPRALAWLSNLLLVGSYHSEDTHPVSRVLHRLYEGPCRFVVKHARWTILAAMLLVALTVPVYLHLGSEFMPPLREGTLLFMPSAVEPGISVAEARKVLQLQDQILAKFPEVERVFGKAGRANSSTDPAPLSMMETTITLKPQSQWRSKPRWYSRVVPMFMQPLLTPFWPDKISEEELIDEMNRALAIPGISNAWTMPIRGRLDMLSTGVRTPVGIKVAGNNLDVVSDLALQVEASMRKVQGVRSVVAERITGGFFVDFVWKRAALARYGLSIEDANTLVMTAVGGDNQSVTIEGRERYGVNVRYARDYRDDIDSLKRVRVSLASGLGQIPIEEIADVKLAEGPSMIRDENGLLAAYVYVDFDSNAIDVGSFVARAKLAVDQSVHPPTGVSITWSGQYENMERVRQRLWIIVPVTLLLIFALLLANTKSAFKSLLVMAAVPFSAIGAVWLLAALGYNLSIAVWVGLIALLGLDAETGVFMLLYLDLAYDEAKRAGRLRDRRDLVEAIVHGAVKRIRPKAMTVVAAFMGLLPIMWSIGTGSDLMKRIAAPMVGGLVTSFALELLVVPAIYFLWKSKGLPAVSNEHPSQIGASSL